MGEYTARGEGGVKIGNKNATLFLDAPLKEFQEELSDKPLVKFYNFWIGPWQNCSRNPFENLWKNIAGEMNKSWKEILADFVGGLPRGILASIPGGIINSYRNHRKKNLEEFLDTFLVSFLLESLDKIQD